MRVSKHAFEEFADINEALKSLQTLTKQLLRSLKTLMRLLRSLQTLLRLLRS